MKRCRLVLLLLIVVSTTFGLEVEHVHTKLGDIKGVVEHVRNEKVYQFRNVPYAKPPIGPLRFAKPEVKVPWSGTLDATKFGPSCMQPAQPLFNKYLPNITQSEDCLVLNIYVPRDMSSTTKRAVMVWVHGGSYIVGQGMFYDGSYLALTGDVVVVTINYRLGLFGFISTPGADGLKGNYGLWDQRMALQWVKDNIDDFGGNPNSVTIFGESAGGFSVSLQALAPQNQDLFHRVIAQSGSALSSFSYTSLRDAHESANRVGMKFGCANATGISSIYTQCMRQPTANEILAAQTELSLPTLEPFVLLNKLGPTLINDFLPSLPDSLLKNKTSSSFNFFQSMDFMTGNTDTEGSLFLEFLPSASKEKKFNISVGIPSHVFCDYIVPAFVDTYFDSHINSTAPSDLVCSQYRNPNDAQQAANAVDAFSLVFFVAPAIKSAMKHSENNNRTSTYQYIFKRPVPDPAFQGFPHWLQNDSSGHGSEILFLFGLEGFPTKYNISVSPGDVNLSRAMQKYWTNFAKTGNPNSDDLPMWSTYDGVQQRYIDLDTAITSGTHLYGDVVSLWLDRLPKLAYVQDTSGVLGK